MIQDKLTIFANEEDTESIFELVLKCIDKADINMVFLLAVADGTNKDNLTLPEGIRCVVLPFDMKGFVPSDVRKITYCEGGASGDISALNVQKRETCTCFEVLYGVFMSRVFIPFGSKYTVKQVLLCVCIMCGWGASIDKLIPLLNELLK